MLKLTSYEPVGRDFYNKHHKRKMSVNAEKNCRWHKMLQECHQIIKRK